MKQLLLTNCLILMMFAAVAQNKERINDIEQKCKIINLAPAYQIKTLEGADFLDSAFINQPNEGYGKLTGYFRNDTLFKIREFYGIKKLEIIGITEYYYWENKLIFVHETENSGPDVLMDSSGTIDYRVKVPEFEGLYYFFSDMLIYKLVEGEQAILPNEKFFDSQSKEGQLLSSSGTNISLLKKE